MSNAAISPRARWSMTLRSNSRNLEDRKGYEGTSRGLLWGGECAKVIELAELCRRLGDEVDQAAW